MSRYLSRDSGLAYLMNDSRAETVTSGGCLSRHPSTADVCGARSGQVPATVIWVWRSPKASALAVLLVVPVPEPVSSVSFGS